MIRLGAIPYLNCRPYYEAFRRGEIDLPAEIVWDVPSAVNRMLLEGSIDLGPIAVAAWARRPDLFEVVPGLAIASAGPVRSILLATHEPWERLGGRRIVCDAASETSVALLEILSRRTHAVPVRTAPRSHEDSRTEGLHIGDNALRLGSSPPAGLRLHDLGAMWDDETGLPMTYAIWAARKDSIARDPGGVEAAVAALGASLEWGERNIRAIAENAVVPPAEAAVYLLALAAARLHPRREEGMSLFTDLFRPAGALV